MILAFDIGGTFIKWAIAEDYTLLRKGKVQTPRESFDELVNTLRTVLKENSEFEISGIAVSYPGMADPSTGRLVPIGALTYGFNQPVKKMLEDALGLPVSLENDGRLAALAEVRLGCLKDVNSAYVLVVGTGIGGAYVRNKTVETGTHGYAGQASLILVNDLRAKGLDAIFSSHTGMHDFLEHASEVLEKENLSGEEFMAMVKDGHETANELFEQYMNAFTDVLFTLQMLLDPEVFAIGGGISADEYYIRAMQEKYEEIYNMFHLELPHAQIRPCQFRNDANILGALCLFYDEHDKR